MRPEAPDHGTLRQAEATPVLVLVLVPAGACLLLLIASLGGAMAFWGDEALAEAAVVDALSGDARVGPFSNWGYAHPGPALFYLLAPPYALAGRDPVGLAIGATMINAAAMLGTVLVIRRFVSTPAAGVTAFILLCYAVALQPEGFYDHWNPSLVPLPLLLTMVLAAAAWSGSLVALSGAALTGTLVAQTHLGSVPVVAAILTAGLVGAVRHHRRARHTGSPRPGALGPGALLAAGLVTLLAIAAWMPPLSEELTNDPGNVSRMVEFFRDPPEGVEHGQPLADSVMAVSDQSLLLPFGWGGIEPARHRLLNPPDPSRAEVAEGWIRLAVWLAALAASVWAMGGAVRRREPVMATLAGLPLLVTALLVLSATRIIGPLFNYLLWGAMVSLIPTWIVLGTRLVAWLEAHRPAWRQPLRRAVWLASLAPALVFAAMVVAHGTLEPEPFARSGAEIASRAVDRVPDGAAVVVRWDETAAPQAVGSSVLGALRRNHVDARPHLARYLPSKPAEGDEICEVSIGPEAATAAAPDGPYTTQDGLPYWVGCR